MASDEKQGDATKDAEEVPLFTNEQLTELAMKVDTSFDLSLRKNISYNCNYRIGTCNNKEGGFIRLPFWSLYNNRHVIQLYIIKAQTKKMWIGIVSRAADPLFSKLDKSEETKLDDLDVPHRVSMHNGASYYLTYHFKSNSQKRADLKKKIKY